MRAYDWTYPEDLPNVRYRLEPDEDMGIMDEQGEGVWCGRLEWTRRDDCGHTTRPVGFTGAAEILEHDYRHSLWWEPEPDCVADVGIRDAVRSSIRELVTYGYHALIVERVREDDRDAFGNPIVAAVTALGGLEPFPEDDYVSELVTELAAEIGVDQ